MHSKLLYTYRVAKCVRGLQQKIVAPAVVGGVEILAVSLQLCVGRLYHFIPTDNVLRSVTVRD